MAEAPISIRSSGGASVSSPQWAQSTQLRLAAVVLVFKANTTGDSRGQPLRGGLGMFPVWGELDSLVPLQNLQLPFNSCSV